MRPLDVSARVIFSSILDWMRSSMLTESAGLPVEDFVTAFAVIIYVVFVFCSLLRPPLTMPDEIRWAG